MISKHHFSIGYTRLFIIRLAVYETSSVAFYGLTYITVSEYILALSSRAGTLYAQAGLIIRLTAIPLSADCIRTSTNGFMSIIRHSFNFEMNPDVWKLLLCCLDLDIVVHPTSKDRSAFHFPP